MRLANDLKLLLSLLMLVLAGCATTTPPPVTHGASLAAAQASKMVGKPYKYGGASPSGFDCSGLVQYSFKHAGVSVPHNTAQQRSASRRIKMSELQRGDLLFFDQEGRKNSHVGIYLGDGRFVHAPSSGKSVRSDSLSSPYWKKHLSEARRI